MKMFHAYEKYALQCGAKSINEYERGILIGSKLGSFFIEYSILLFS